MNEETGYWDEVYRVKDDAIPPDFETKFAYDEDDFITERVWREYSEEELEGIRKGEENEVIQEWLPSAKEIQEEQDAAICDLYEQTLAQQEETDAAICALYEIIIGG